MNKIVLLSFLSIFLVLSTGFNSSPERWYCEELKYTYQIEVFNTRRQIQVSTELCDLITRNRKEEADTYVQLYDNVRLKILSSKTIEKGLVEIPQFVYHN